jgi:hypothetical protein
MSPRDHQRATARRRDRVDHIGHGAASLRGTSTSSPSAATRRPRAPGRRHLLKRLDIVRSDTAAGPNGHGVLNHGRLELASALVSPVEALLGRAIVLIGPRDHTRVPTQKLLGTRWETEYEVVAERADVVDLLLEE